jgi:hypothetical protein
VYGAYSVLSDALKPDNGNFIEKFNPISSISFCNNKVDISSFTNVRDIYGASLSLNGDLATLENVSLSNNYILFNSSANVSNSVYAAYLSQSGSISNFENVSLSNNTVEIKDTISSRLNIYTAFLSATGSAAAGRRNYSITNNKIILSKDNLDLSGTNLYAYYNHIEYNTDNSSEENIIISNNALQINNAKNVLVGSIHNFDTFSFNLPTNLSNYDTLLTLIHQGQDIPVDAHKLYISNYGHHTSTLTVNLIDAPGYGLIDLSNANGSYLYDHTRTQLKVKDKKLVFIFNPSIAPSPNDPIDPAPPDSPAPPPPPHYP